MQGRRKILPDEELVRAFQKTGDGECFDEIFSRYGRKVYGFCRGIRENREDAEDATQETFLRVYKSIRTFEGDGFSQWLMQIARRVCIDAWRKARSEVGIEDAGISSGLVASGPSPDNHLMAELLRQRMRDLSPVQRQCMELFHFEGCTYAEVATRCGLSVEEVKSHLQNGKRMLWIKMKGAISRQS